MNKEFLIVIPARFKSSRFPGKPLADIKGKSMIFRVWEKCVSACSKDNVIVAERTFHDEEEAREYYITLRGMNGHA